MKVDDIISKLNLKPHPEGGYFKATYKSDVYVPVDDSYDPPRTRRSATSIYYLLRQNEFSAWHRVKSDEQWHHYEGNPVLIRVIDQDTRAIHAHKIFKVSADGDTKPQFLVPRGIWFCAEPVGDGEGSLVGCTVSPGFDNRDFELASRDKLITEYPEHEATILSSILWTDVTESDHASDHEATTDDHGHGYLPCPEFSDAVLSPVTRRRRRSKIRLTYSVTSPTADSPPAYVTSGPIKSSVHTSFCLLDPSGEPKLSIDQSPNQEKLPAHSSPRNHITAKETHTSVPEKQPARQKRISRPLERQRAFDQPLTPAQSQDQLEPTSNLLSGDTSILVQLLQSGAPEESPSQSPLEDQPRKRSTAESIQEGFDEYGKPIRYIDESSIAEPIPRKPAGKLLAKSPESSSKSKIHESGEKRPSRKSRLPWTKTTASADVLSSDIPTQAAVSLNIPRPLHEKTPPRKINIEVPQTNNTLRRDSSADYSQIFKNNLSSTPTPTKLSLPWVRHGSRNLSNRRSASPIAFFERLSNRSPTKGSFTPTGSIKRVSKNKIAQDISNEAKTSDGNDARKCGQKVNQFNFDQTSNIKAQPSTTSRSYNELFVSTQQEAANSSNSKVSPAAKPSKGLQSRIAQFTGKHTNFTSATSQDFITPPSSPTLSQKNRSPTNLGDPAAASPKWYIPKSLLSAHSPVQRGSSLDTMAPPMLKPVVPPKPATLQTVAPTASSATAPHSFSNTLSNISERLNLGRPAAAFHISPSPAPLAKVDESVESLSSGSDQPSGQSGKAESADQSVGTSLPSSKVYHGHSRSGSGLMDIRKDPTGIYRPLRRLQAAFVPTHQSVPRILPDPMSAESERIINPFKTGIVPKTHRPGVTDASIHNFTTQQEPLRK